MKIVSSYVSGVELEKKVEKIILRVGNGGDSIIELRK